MSDRHLRRAGSDYRDAFLELLPQGQAWPKHSLESTLWQSCDGLCNYWGYVDGRAADLLERESDPRQTVELLPDWERNWGLPDPCYTAPQSIDERQKALVARMTLYGSQSRQFYIDFVKFLGYDITITEYRPFMVGIDRCGDNRVYGDDAGPPPLYYNDMFVKGWLPVCDPLGRQLTAPSGHEGVGYAAGTGTAIGNSPIFGVGVASGVSTANGAGRSTTPGVAFADARGVVTATATGRSTAIAQGNAQNIGSVTTGVGRSTAAAKAAAAGIVTVSGVGFH
jgi:uncharacterized protein YmfQ (DUF2313 family)